MGDTVGDMPFQVGITFNEAKISIGNKTLENLIGEKAMKEHTHTIGDIPNLESTINSKLENCVIKDTTTGDIYLQNGTVYCGDVNFSIDGVGTILSEKIKALANENMTIQHLTLTYDSNVKVGSPVFYTGEVASKDLTPIIISSTDCVPLVKSTGDWKTFAGICTEVDVSYKNKTTKYYRNNKCAFIRFATHGDFEMSVEDGSKYKVGDLITFDGGIVNTDEIPTFKVQQSIVGSVTSIIDDSTVSVFRI